MITKKKKIEAQSCNFVQTLRALFPPKPMCVYIYIYIEQSCQNHLVLVTLTFSLPFLFLFSKKANKRCLFLCFFGSSTLTFSLFLFLHFLSLSQEKKNVTRDRKKQQDPTHCSDPTDGPTLEEGGAHRGGACAGTSFADRRSRRTRGGLRRDQLQEVHRARDAPEPPHLQAPPRTSRRRVRVFQPGPPDDSMRRVVLRRGPPSRDSLVVVVDLVRRVIVQLPRRHQEPPRLLRWISTVASWVGWYQINLLMSYGICEIYIYNSVSEPG